MTTSVLFAGLPQTGKTSYLALLNLAMGQRRRAALALGSFKDDREYLNSISDHLFSGVPLPRTRVGHTGGLSLSIEIPGRGATRLEIPDTSGEAWEHLLISRSWEVSLQQRAVDSSGVCVFVHSGLFAKDPPLSEVRAGLDALGAPAEAGANARYKDDRPFGQVALLDLLQILGRQFGGPEGRRISLVLSAFDAAGSPSPTAWLHASAPIVEQFVSSNPSRPAVRLFGLSAQGGRFDDEGEKLALLERDPLDRAFVLRSDSTVAELDEPVRWAMGIE
jgi:hypothetical protein